MKSKLGATLALAVATWLAACGDASEPSAQAHKSQGTAGSPSTRAPASSTSDTAAAPSAAEPVDAEPKFAMDECDLHTKWRGDEYCIQAPPAEKGFQLHIGPSDYENPEPQYVMQPGQETVENIPVTSGNDEEVYYYFRQYRMRPGSHHLIMYGGGEGARRLGGTQNLAKDNPDRGVIAPENAGIGMKLAPKTPITINLHYMNYTDKPTIKEAWINFWYRDPADVTQPANELFSPTPMNVAAGQHVVIHSTCTISQTGRVLTMYGHRHANNVRFSAWRESGNQKDLIYDDYNWEDPLVLEFSTTVKNPAADPAARTPGGWTGPLDLMAGDKLSFECEIINMSNKTFRGANEAKDDEMCILVGDTVNTSVPGFCTSTTTPVN